MDLFELKDKYGVPIFRVNMEHESYIYYILKLPFVTDMKP